MPTFPPNRVIVEGERVCQICGSGKAAHDGVHVKHPFPPDPDCDPGVPLRDVDAVFVFTFGLILIVIALIVTMVVRIQHL